MMELLRSDMAARGVIIKNKKESAPDLSDKFAGARGQYAQIDNKECETARKAIAEHHNQLAKRGAGVIAINSAIYDLDGDLALYQTRFFLKADGQRFAKTKIRYWLARISGGDVIESKPLEVKGQTIHYFIRNGISPLAALRSEKKL